MDAVLFDIDGTLVDSIAAVVRAISDTWHTYAGRSHPDAVIRGMIGRPLHWQFRTLEGFAPDDATVKAMISTFIRRMEVHRHLEHEFGPAVQALRELSEHHVPTALVTSKSRPELEDFLPHFSGRDYAQVCVTATDVAHPKPAPDCVELACAQLGVRPERAVLIGDSIYDLGSARAAGSMAVAVGYGAGDPEALRRENPDAFFSTPEDLLTWVRHELLPQPCPAKS
jgi:HAD superfamily hydrolase (TIGR01509 family)